jgi:hypothetical protein
MRIMATMATKIGADGKSYPAHQPGGALPEAVHREAINVAHHLIHGLHYSYRAAQTELLAEHGIRRSLGSLHHDLAEFTCRDCADGLPQPGANVTAPADGAW